MSYTLHDFALENKIDLILLEAELKAASQKEKIICSFINFLMDILAPDIDEALREYVLSPYGMGTSLFHASYMRGNGIETTIRPWGQDD